MDNTYTKLQLIQMNTSNPLWFKSILNIDNLSDNNNDKARIYPTYDAGLQYGRLYVALPTDLELTYEIKEKYNIWM